MLYQIGALTIDTPTGLNAQSVDEEFGGDFAVKPIVGAQQPREFVGPSDTRLRLAGTIFPFRFAAAGGSSGLNEIELLKQMAASGEPQMVIRGDGMVMGWYVIERSAVRHANLAKQGFGREQQFSIDLVSSPTGASAASLIDTLELLFQ